MRQRLIRKWLGIAVAALCAPAISQAQFSTEGSVPNQPAVMAHLPTGNPGGSGFYAAADAVFFTQTRTIGDQTVAFRGLVDSNGFVTGRNGTYIGSGATALTTDQFGRSSFAPGYRVYLGWKTDEGTTFSVNFLQTMDVKYNAGATLVSPFFRGLPNGADTYLFSGVYNFPTDYAGPAIKTGFDSTTSPFNFYGIWNGASEMNIEYTQRYTEGEIVSRTPIFQTDYSRVYAIAGARYAWFYDKFWWRTVSRDINGQALPQDVAIYSNILSQRMYGPVVGCGHEIYAGKAFAVSLDLTGSALIDIIKERQKYKLGDEVNPTANKHKRTDYHIVPNGNAALNVWWYPIEGVQVRLGYNAMTYFNTKNMQNPISFNFGALDPVYNTQAFRLVHGFNLGLGLFF